MNHIVRNVVLLSDFCRNVLRLAVFNSFGECSIRKQRAFVLSKPAQDYSLSQAHDRVMTGSKMKTVKPQALVVTAIIIILSLLFWGAWLFLGYVADDWSSPPADERSVPAARTY